LSQQCPTDSSDPDDLALAPLLYHPHPLQSVSRTPPLKFLPGRKSQVLTAKKCRITSDHSTPPPTALAGPSTNAGSSRVVAFSPMSTCAPPHTAHNLLPSSIRGLHGVEAVDIFRLFLTDSLLNTISTNTNAYAQKKIEEQENSGARVWVEVKPQEIGAWIGIVLYMGVHRSPAIPDYWRHDGLSPTHPITNYMSQTRFEQVKRYFHVSDLDEVTVTAKGRRLWHCKVDPLLDQLRKSSQAYRLPSSNVSVDEAMIRCTGRSQDTYKMPSKPIEHGFRFHCLAEHGYIHPGHFRCCSSVHGQDRFRPGGSFAHHWPQTTAMMFTLQPWQVEASRYDLSLKLTIPVDDVCRGSYLALR
jgi:hypothetical protein